MKELQQRLRQLQQQLSQGRPTPEPMSIEELKAYGEKQAQQYVNRVQQEAKQSRINRLMSSADVDIERYNFGNFDPSRLAHGEALLEAAWTYANQMIANLNNQALLLLGDHGTGKTHLAVSVLAHIRQQGGRSVLAKQWRNLAPELMSGARNNNEEARRESQKLRNMVVQEAEVLLLDEVGAAQYALSPAQQQELGQLLRQRINLGLPTVITSNHSTLEELGPAISQFALEGLMESQPLILQFAGESQRQPAAVIGGGPTPMSGSNFSHGFGAQGGPGYNLGRRGGR